MFLILFGFLSLLFLYKWWRQPKDEPPLYSGALPVIGHAHALIGDSACLWRLFQKMGNESLQRDGVLTFKILSHRVYIVTDPDDAMTVANICLDKNDYYKFADDWLGRGIIMAPSSVWKGHRKLMNLTFNQRILDGYLHIFNQQARKLTKTLELEMVNPFDPYAQLRTNALETVCLTTLGVDFSDHEILGHEYVEAVEDIINILTRRLQSPLHNDWVFGWSNLKKEQDKVVKILHKPTNLAIERKLTEVTENKMSKDRHQKLGTNCKTLLDLLLEMRDEKNGLSLAEIKDELNNIIVSGHETSSIALVYILAYIGTYPEVQQKIYAELEEMFGKSERDVEKSDLGRLVYLEAVMRESLRVTTIGPIMARQLNNDVKLRNYTLHAGGTCAIFLSHINRHPMWGVDADQFRPDRWLNPATLPTHPAASASFSLGKRNCIGKSYGMMTMKIILVHLLRRYKVQGDCTNLVVRWDSTLKPVSGHHISLERRL